tara:strand:+ start:2776 stop:4014 length:1239 start_codon:yes stop_codon:yes gene_type:complete
MAKKEKVVEELQQEVPVVKPAGSDEKVDDKPLKVKTPPKRKMKNLGETQDNVVKIDLSKATEEQPKEEVVEEKEVVEEPKEQVVEEIKDEQPEQKEEKVEEETPVVEEITDEEVEEKVEELQEEVEEAISEAQETAEPLPENIQKVVDFMNETGGSLEDYVKLNQDFSKYDDNTLLREYFKQTKPHLTDDEISFIMEDLYSWDEEVDEERDVRRKKLAFKEQVANAKRHLDGQKSKYYEEIKSGVKLTPDQQKAVDFFNRYNKESEQSNKIAKEQRQVFENKTNKLFNKEFKGFEFKLGEKRFRYNVKDAAKVKENQSDINNFASKFLDKKNQLVDPEGYHKALFTANNPDAIANHFYQQGKADAMKESMAKAKNVDMSARQTHSGVVEAGGIKVRAITGDDSSRLRVKMRK